MRFVGLLLVLIGLAVGYYLGFRGESFAQMRNRLAQLLNLPGIAATRPPSNAAGSAPAAKGMAA